MNSEPEGVIPRPGGRPLGYVEYGDPKGRPVMFFHGLPGSHIEAHGLAQAAAALGVRLVAVDRPGMGLSGFQRGRRLADWPTDVVALADALGVDRFAVLGLSGGGPYAACCAHQIGHRITSATIISGLAPLDSPNALDGLNDHQLQQRQGFLKVRKAPVLARLVAMSMVRKKGKPDAVLAFVRDSMSPVDQARIDASTQLQHELVASYQQAFDRGSRGFARDLRLLCAGSWGFDCEDITIPVHLWHGEADDNVPTADGHRLAAAIPNCTATFVPSKGHLLFLDHAEEILAATAT